MLQEEGSIERNHEDNVDSQTEVTAPLVFQCSECRQIIGDSFNWVVADEELQALTLSKASNVKIEEKLITSETGKDLGATYAEFRCQNCQNILGRIYRTTPRSLDPIRDYYTYQLSSLTSYQLGGNKEEPQNLGTYVFQDIWSWQKGMNELVLMVHGCMDRISQLEEQVANLITHFSCKIRSGLNED